MNNLQKILVILVILIISILAGLYVTNGSNISSTNNNNYNTTELTDKLSINMSNWQYDEENDIYYQIGLVYCTNPESTDYESLGIYVPGAYFESTDNGNGTYTCSVNSDGKVGNYSSSNAPIVMPINTAGYSAMAAPSSYNSQEISDYTNNGLIYLYAGCRGRENGDTYSGGAPWGVTDLKAAIRYVRFNQESLPGDSESIFTFGMSGGGAQSALVGVTGNSNLYTPYLENIGAAMVDSDGNTISDSVYGSMCWCPITSLDYADEAYEWNMGQYSDSGTRSDSTWTSSLSDDLATEYATYINELKLKDSNGKTLSLEESNTGIYTSGSYYDYMKSVIEESLNNFLVDTNFPYTPSNGLNIGGGMPSGEAPNGNIPSGETPDNNVEFDEKPSGDLPNGDISIANQPMDMQTDSSSSSSTTYNSAQEYIDSLNSEIKWISYDAETNTATVENIEGFVKTCKNPTKDVCAFDGLQKSEAENQLFGNDNSDYMHFDNTIYELLSANSEKYQEFGDYDSSLVDSYKSDLDSTDKLNTSMQTRVDMYNPMYYLCDYYDGSGSSTPAKYWRINTGIEQGDTSLCVETNLALALNQTSGVEDVEFTTVWGQGHTTAERSGDSTTNFINWINECLN